MRKQLTSVRELEKVASQSRRIDFAFALEHGKGLVEVKAEARPAASPKHFLRTSVSAWDAYSRKGWGEYLPDNLRDPLRRLRDRYPRAKLRLDKIACKSQRSPVQGAALRLLVAQALGEVFGAEVEPHALAASGSSQGAERAQWIRALIEGKRGVEKWNRLGKNALRANGPFRKVALEGLKLDGIEFGELDLQNSNLRKASLKRAHLSGGDFKHADLSFANLSAAFCVDTKFHSARIENARLVGANCIRAIFRGASLRNSQFQKADLREADFCGADLTGATLNGAKAGRRGEKGTRYDKKTSFPDGFRPGKGWFRVER